jgi:hypothetical protein
VCVIFARYSFQTIFVCIFLIKYHTVSHHTHTHTTISHHTSNAVPNVQGVEYCRRICSLGAMQWLLTRHHSYQWRIFQIHWVLFQSLEWILGFSNLHMSYCCFSFITPTSVVMCCSKWEADECPKLLLEHRLYTIALSSVFTSDPDSVEGMSGWFYCQGNVATRLNYLSCTCCVTIFQREVIRHKFWLLQHFM